MSSLGGPTLKKRKKKREFPKVGKFIKFIMHLPINWIKFETFKNKSSTGRGGRAVQSVNFEDPGSNPAQGKNYIQSSLYGPFIWSL